MRHILFGLFALVLAVMLTGCVSGQGGTPNHSSSLSQVEENTEQAGGADDATEQNEYGFAAVKQNGLWGSIDKDGKIIINPEYNLDNYLKINFIGKWHLGEDININYYCEE